MKLYSYYRSSSAYRVRIALNHKQIGYDYKAIHLLKDGGEQNKEAYTALNPKAEVPTLVDKNIFLSQSVAIFFYLDRAYIEKPLFPKHLPDFERCLELVEIINSGTQPLQNLSVLQKLKKDFSITEDQKLYWCRHFIDKGLKAFDAKCSEEGPFALGSEITAADMFLLPQLYNAKRFGLELSSYKNLQRIYDSCEELDAFLRAHPDKQPDKPKD